MSPDILAGLYALADQWEAGWNEDKYQAAQELRAFLSKHFPAQTTKDEGAGVAGYAIVTKDGFISEYTKDDDQAYARKLPDEAVITLYTHPAPAGKVRVTEAMSAGDIIRCIADAIGKDTDPAKLRASIKKVLDAYETAALAAQPAVPEGVDAAPLLAQLDSLISRVRPDSEAAPWVVAELKKMRDALAAARQEDGNG